MGTFVDRLEARAEQINSLVCVGLDTDPTKIAGGMGLATIGAESMLEFNRRIIDATADVALAYKPNTAFYEAQKSAGVAALEATCEYIRDKVPGALIIIDGKRGDIGNTSEAYAQAFDGTGADAITLNPYLGEESLRPFLNRSDIGTIILCLTSNPGSDEIQKSIVTYEDKQMPLYQSVAARVAHKWQSASDRLLVVGATKPEELAEVRAITGDDMWFLVPGVGAQGGDVEATVKAGVNSRGTGIIVNSSRSIIYASQGPDFDEAARNAAISLRDEINQYRKAA